MLVSARKKNIPAKWIYVASKSKILAVPFILLNSFECIRKCFTWTDACDLPMIHFIQRKRTKYTIIACLSFFLFSPNTDLWKSVTLHMRARKSCRCWWHCSKAGLNGRTSRAAARGVYLFRAPRRHWNSRQYGSCKFRFHTRKIPPKIIRSLARAYIKVRHPCPGPKKFKEYRF